MCTIGVVIKRSNDPENSGQPRYLVDNETDLKQAQYVSHHDGLGGERGSDDSGHRFVGHVERGQSGFALVLGRVL